MRSFHSSSVKYGVKSIKFQYSVDISRTQSLSFGKVFRTLPDLHSYRGTRWRLSLCPAQPTHLLETSGALRTLRPELGWRLSRPGQRLVATSLLMTSSSLVTLTRSSVPRLFTTSATAPWPGLSYQGPSLSHSGTSTRHSGRSNNFPSEEE